MLWLGPSGLAEEPPANVKKMLEKFDILKSTIGYQNQIKIMNEILGMSAEEFFQIGILTPPNQYGIVKNTMKNVPSKMVLAWSFPTPAPYNTFTFYFTK
jgi:peptide/nickel transport system substrate-binding protein